ncbi:pentapeptide repeat-containing protein [Leptothoe kymatousa]|uniref:pentapeptide repeat-containing protein n=1 Tax=Leptothoe kymatousa TaxID=2651727 RepID=UPI00389941F9
MTLVSAYVGWRALKGDERDAWIRSVAIAFAAIGGTSFREATLTNADFSQARLKSTDIRRAVLLRTRWRDADKLDRVRPGETYLNNPKIRELVLTGNGQGQSYDYLLNLAGINLQGANLVKADFTGSILKEGNLQGVDLTNARFIGANCNGINLQDADLSGSKLVQTQLDEADLTGSTLTGAYIEDWNITTKTRLDGIRCDYVFMRLPPEDDLNSDPHRKPDDKQKTFADGEFSDFIAPMVETLDLYHNQVLDPRALAIAFHELRENNPNADLEIISMEKRGKQRDQLLVRAETSQQSDLSALHRQYFERYDYLLTLPPQAMQALLIEKDREVQRLAGLVGTAIGRPSTQINKTYQGDTTVSEQGSNAPKYDLSNAQFAGGFAEIVEGNQIGGTINNAAAETPSLAEAAAEIQALLQQLEQTAPAETTTQKMTLATQAIGQIEANPTFKQRTVAALTAGGIKAFEAAIDHPVAAFVVGAIEEWKKA